MRRTVYIYTGLILALLVLAGFAEALQAAELTTDSKVYKLGETVELTITNTGDEPITYPVVYQEITVDPTDWHGLKITNVKTGEVVVTYPKMLCYYKPFEPGESRTLLWNQTYSVYEDIPWQGTVGSPLNGQQVPPGKYIAKVLPDLEVTFRIIKHP